MSLIAESAALPVTSPPAEILIQAPSLVPTMRGSALQIVLEPQVDFDATADQLDRSFSQGYNRDGVYLDWLYNRSCSRRAIVVSAYDDGIKIGQMVFIPHEINVGGQRTLLGLTVDFFVVPEHRHAPVVIKLTRTAMQIGREQGLDGVIGVPNVKSLPVVSRFMKTVPTRKLGLRVGLAIPRRRKTVGVSVEAAALDNKDLLALIEPYLTETPNARIWTARSLLRRLRTPATRFALHSCGDTLAISCRFVIKGMTFTMLCGFLSRTPAPVARDTIDALVAAACRLQGRPNFCYIGVNKALAGMPGFAVSERIHHSPLTVVARMFADGLPPFVPDRYEMIDFDIV